MPPKKKVIFPVDDKDEVDQVAEDLKELTIKKVIRKRKAPLIGELTTKLETLTINKKARPMPITLAEEVLDSVIEWYESRGQAVPKEDMEACEAMLKEEKEEKKQFQEMLEGPHEPVKEKPSFGSPEYWKDYWEKKKASGYVTKKDAAKAAKASKEKTNK